MRMVHAAGSMLFCGAKNVTTGLNINEIILVFRHNFCSLSGILLLVGKRVHGNFG